MASFPTTSTFQFANMCLDPWENLDEHPFSSATSQSFGWAVHVPGFSRLIDGEFAWICCSWLTVMTWMIMDGILSKTHDYSGRTCANDFRIHYNPTVQINPSGSGRAVSEVSLTQMPWNFKIFYGLLLDRITFFGSRRKGWNLGCS